MFNPADVIKARRTTLLRFIAKHAMATIPQRNFVDKPVDGLKTAAVETRRLHGAGAATPVAPEFISPADPASRWTAADGGLAFFAYCTDYLISLKCAVILDVEATTAVRQAEVTAQKRTLDRVSEGLALWPERLVADASDGSAENLASLVHERSIKPHIPVFVKSTRTDGSFARSVFTDDHKRDRYICPPARS